MAILAVGVAAVGATGPAVAAASDRVLTQNASAEKVSTTPKTTAATAAARAAALVAERPESLYAGADDGFVPRPVITSMGWHYVPYERTYRGLPVVGGDFVIIVDPGGRVAGTSVAQQRVLRGVGTTPKVTLAAAQEVSNGQLRSVSRSAGGRLVVYARGPEPRLAWETNVEGTGEQGHSRLTVHVDAQTGTLLDTQENVHYDSGNGAYNGPSPLTVAASASTTDPGVRVLKDPVTKRLSCADWGTRTIFDSTDTAWGTGVMADVETQCVDAMFAAQTQVKMLSSWLGRNGMDGQGGAWPIFVGLDEDNAFFGFDHVRLGVDDDFGLPYTPIDVVGHEFGHGIDLHTPGGFSRKGTSEFIADVFGTATEWYANQSAPFDAPDFTVGESVKENRYAIRYMHHPSQGGAGIPNCYHSGVDDLQQHAAAGVGNHWFYLLAQGTNPGGGHPSSRTCNHTTLTGIGIKKATQILYHAMLMKTSDSSYQAYRSWTLTAARNVFADACATYAKVKAAWDAVRVPAQPGEPACLPGSHPSARTVAGDFNGDGRDDLAFTGLAEWTTVPVAISRGDGTFALQADWTHWGFPGWASVPGVTTLSGDFNGDGKSDLALTGGAGWTTLPVALSNGDGTFTVHNSWSHWGFPGWASTAGAKPVVGDFNGDGRSDIALTGGAGWTTVPVALSNGDGTFTVHNSWSHWGFPGWAQDPAARVSSGDLNGDGRSDLVLTGGASWTTVPVALSNGDATFTVYSNWSHWGFPGWAATSGAKTLAGDFSGDGRTDIALTGGAGWTTLPLAVSHGEASFTVHNSWTHWGFPGWAQEPDARAVGGDFNGDGRSDIALTGPPHWTTIPIAFSNGDATFTVTNQ